MYKQTGQSLAGMKILIENMMTDSKTISEKHSMTSSIHNERRLNYYVD